MRTLITAQILALTAAAALASPAAANVPPPVPDFPEPPMVGFFDASKAQCFSRVYDAGHLKAHPKQKVTALAFAYTPTIAAEGQVHPMWLEYGETPGFIAKLAVTVRGEPRPALGGAECHRGKTDQDLQCGIEGDGGSFTLTLQKDGRLRLDNAAGFTVTIPSENPEDAEDGAIQIDPKDDHEAFLIAPATGGLCDAEW